MFVLLNSVASSLDAQEVTLSEKLRSKCLGPWATGSQGGRRLTHFGQGESQGMWDLSQKIGCFFPYNSGIMILPPKIVVGNEFLKMIISMQCTHFGFQHKQQQSASFLCLYRTVEPSVQTLLRMAKEHPFPGNVKSNETQAKHKSEKRGLQICDFSSMDFGSYVCPRKGGRETMGKLWVPLETSKLHYSRQCPCFFWSNKIQHP